MVQFHTKVVGVTFDDRQTYIKKMKIGDKITLKRDKENQYDPNAIMVINYQGNHIGFISKDLSKQMAPNMDKGINYIASVSNISEEGDQKVIGVNLVIRQVN